eukprot:6202155-Pleurochrysis_carterae.AAC.4
MAIRIFQLLREFRLYALPERANEVTARYAWSMDNAKTLKASGNEIEISVQIALSGEAAISYVTESAAIESPDRQRLDRSTRQC